MIKRPSSQGSGGADGSVEIRTLADFRVVIGLYGRELTNYKPVIRQNLI
jgi:hypothetical protein